MTEPGRRSIEDILSERVRLAAESYKEEKAKAALLRAREESTSAPERNRAYRNALRAERVALEVYTSALRELSEFLFQGKIPEIEGNPSSLPEAPKLPVREPGA